MRSRLGVSVSDLVTMDKARDASERARSVPNMPHGKRGRGGSACRVLIVDDEEEFCQVLFVRLKTEGFEPMVAHGGETALEMIRQGLPDVVLLDVKMPGIDGVEVLKRSKESQPDIPVLMMTAYGGVSAAVEALKSGAYDYLVKPLDNRNLVEKLRRAHSLAPKPEPRQSRRTHGENVSGLSLKEGMGPSGP